MNIKNKINNIKKKLKKGEISLEIIVLLIIGLIVFILITYYFVNKYNGGNKELINSGKEIITNYSKLP